jgi:hypothetical protein
MHGLEKVSPGKDKDLTLILYLLTNISRELPFDKESVLFPLSFKLSSFYTDDMHG